MKRREVLKDLGLGAGFLVFGPSAFSLLQSCKNEKSLTWEPVFLDEPGALVLKEILNVMLPSTDTPGANDLNLAQFVDAYVQEVATEEQQIAFRSGIENFKIAFKEKFQRNISKGSEQEYTEVLSQLLKGKTAEGQKNVKRTTETQDPLDKDPAQKTEFYESCISFLETVRGLGIWGWKNSKVVGEEFLWYDPIPGNYIACGSVRELGNGKAMSL